MIRMFVSGKEVVYGTKDIVVFVFEDKDKELVAGMDELATCLAVYDPDIIDRDDVSEAIMHVKQQCAINPLTRV